MRSSATAAEQRSSVRSRVSAANIAGMLDPLPLELATANKDCPWAQSPPAQVTTHQVPVFRDGQFSGFVEGSSAPHAIICNDQGDAELQHRLNETISKEDWLDPEHVGIAVENRVVRLSGRGDSTHAVLTLRRLAASVPCVAAIIDDLWIDCE